MYWPAVYRFEIEGKMNLAWSNWFEGLRIEYQGGNRTIFTGPIEDESALYGVLNRFRDLNLVLTSIKRISESNIP
jgi:hypothetical protein